MSDGLQEAARRARLDEDIAELEAKLFGPQDESETTETAEQEESVLDNDDVISPDQPSEENEPLTDDPFANETVGEDTQPEKADASEELGKLRREYRELEHRANQYKGKTDRTIFDLRSEVAKLSKTVSRLQKEKVDLQAKLDEQDSKLDEDSRDIFGEEGATLIENLQKQVKQLQRQLTEKDSNTFEETAKQAESSNQDLFMDKLTELVPDIDTWNKDAGFNEWLRQEDDYGIERLATLRSDQMRGDYVRVAQFFNEYKQLKATLDKVKPKKKFSDSSDAYSGPTGTKSNDSNSRAKGKDDGYIKQSEINKYEKDVASGKYKYDSAKAEAMETRIFNAAKEGKIIFDISPTREFKAR
jgi:hypothetical protein